MLINGIVLLAEKFQLYFSSKVDKIHRLITENNCQQHQSAEKHTSSNLRCLPLMTRIDVRNIVKSLKYKSYLLDPLPAFILKDHVVQLAPSICCLPTAPVPVEMKSSVITPIYKEKKHLDVNDISSYRPIAQLPLTAKLTELEVYIPSNGHV